VDDCAVYVSYAKQLLPDKKDDDAGPGHGFIDQFDGDGQLVRRIASRGPLNSPWGMTMVPDHFAHLGGLLLVGNFGDGKVHAYSVGSHPRLVSVVDDGDHKPLDIDGLWALAFGHDGKLSLHRRPRRRVARSVRPPRSVAAATRR
jgi:uncharacterized protein (TIGR03118 family)